MCTAQPLGNEGFLSEWDLSIPGQIECHRVELTGIELTELRTATAILRVFKLVRSLL
jgi:hypothetical protein